MYGPAPSRPEGALPSRCSAELVGHDGAVLNVRFNGSGAYILSCGKDRTVRLWSASRGALLKTYAGHGHEVRDVAVSPDNGRLATCGGDRQVFLWDVASGRTIRKFKGHDRRARRGARRRKRFFSLFARTLTPLPNSLSQRRERRGLCCQR